MNFEPMYPHHDLLIELGLVEMTLERLAQVNPPTHSQLRPQLETRRNHLRDALERLAA